MDAHLTHLIEALGAAPGPSRKLDDQIALAAGWTRPADTHVSYAWLRPDGLRESSSLYFTESVDAALTLVPSGMGCDLHVGPGGRVSEAVVTEPLVSMENGCRITRWRQHKCPATVDGTIIWRNPALALCIASLKARSATIPTGGEEG